MENNLTIHEAVLKVDKYINQLIPLPTCPERKAEAEWKRLEIKKRLNPDMQVKPDNGPSMTK